MGVVPEHCVLFRHCLQVLVARSQWPPGQLGSPVHMTQAPLAAQAGVAALSVVHSPPGAQARQVLVA
jgi:hypothetical protein